MTRPHESPDCRCEGCAGWDYSESRKGALTTLYLNRVNFHGSPFVPTPLPNKDPR